MVFLFWKGSFIKENMIIIRGVLVGKVTMVLGKGFLGTRGITIHLGELTLGKASWLQG